MVDRETLDRRLSVLEESLRSLRGLAGDGADRYRSDPVRRAASERWLQLAAESSIDIAHHLIAESGWRTPATYREAFVVLEENGVVSSSLRQRMEEWAGLRNLLVHLYSRVDPELLWRVLSDELDQLEEFARAVMLFLRTEDQE